MIAIAPVALGSLWAWNFTSLQGPLDKVLASDARNKGIEARAHFHNFMNPDILVFDIRNVASTNSPADVSRVLLQFSSALKERGFDSVVLASRGSERFKLTGIFFATLGREYGFQNPIYTLRTLPENVLNMNGTPAFPTWTGGMLGVTGKQIDDLNEFHKRWWISSALTDS